MANEIVWYHSDEVGAPVMNNAAGSLINVLDACLITGFRLQTLTSVSVSGSVATATLSGHGYADQMMLDISGAAIGSINGRKLITVTGANTFTFPAPGVADSTIAGTIAAKRSPLGWERPAGLQGTNTAIYRRTDVTATGMLLRVDDTSTGGTTLNFARALMLESATDVNTYTLSTPAQQAGGWYWCRGYSNDTAAKPWILVGDGKTFHLFSDYYQTASVSYSFSVTGALVHSMFGDISSYRAGDAYSCVIGGMASSPTTISTSAPAPAMSQSVTLGAAPNIGLVVARSSSQLTNSGVALGILHHATNGSIIGSSSNAGGPTYPSIVDNGLVISSPTLVTENNSTFVYPIRGHLRGVKRPLGGVGNRLHRQVLTGVQGFDGRLLGVAISGGSNNHGCLLFDITGPWE